MTLTVHAGRLVLPVRTPPSVEAVPDLGEAWAPPRLEADVLAPLERGRVRCEHGGEGRPEARVDVVRNLGTMRIHDVGIDLTALGDETYTVLPSDPSTSRAVARRTAAFGRGGWQVRVETESSSPSATATSR